MVRCEYCGKHITAKDIRSAEEFAVRMHLGYKVQCRECAADTRKEREIARLRHLLREATA